MNSSIDPVHISSRELVSGEAIYIDDRLPIANELFVDVVFSKKAHAKIKSISIEMAKSVEGIKGVYLARDFAHNCWGTIFQDQPILADRICQYYGEPICIIAGVDKFAVRKAKKLIEIEYEELSPVLTIDEAIKKEQFIGPIRKIEKGNFEEEFKKCTFKIENFIEIQGQDHFYLESQACIAYPQEGGDIEIHASSQHPTEVQHVVAHSLGLKDHQVTCIVKRMGGAFGGKESQGAPFAAIAALVAQRTGCPARLALTKDDDMIITGKRNPFKNFYKVGFDNEGRIRALEIKLYSDAGAYADLSTAIMERAMLHSDNAYFIPNVSITGTVCKTNFASNTAFRGFGGPKGMVTIESIIEDIANELGKDPLDVRKINHYNSSDRAETPYGQKIQDEILTKLFNTIEKTSNYRERRKEIEEFNKISKTHIKGMSLTAVKFGISFTTRFLNQGSALVNLHMDGTLQVSTGATEMGQGVNTKIAQVVGDYFSIPIENIRIMPTSTEKNHNTSPTAASSGSDINAQAALNACKKIGTRLKGMALKTFDRPENLRGRKIAGAGIENEIDISEISEEQVSKVKFLNGNVVLGEKSISLVELIEEAYLNRISLGDYGFFRYEGIHFNKETGQGNPFFYYTNGVACSEVLIDRLTGELKVLRSDILMDLGRPLNKGIDRGQTTGAFIQGMGWLTTENLFYNKEGALLTYSPSTYKIPSVHDIPREFNVDFLVNDKNLKNLKGSKAVGEPPLMLAISVWTAVKNALSYCIPNKIVKLKVPATQEEICRYLYSESFQ